MYGAETPPDNYLTCDGTAISRGDYVELFNIIGTAYGVGDGSSTFNLPNYAALAPVGFGKQTIDGREKDGGGFAEILEDNTQGHQHDNGIYGLPTWAKFETVPGAATKSITASNSVSMQSAYTAGNYDDGTNGTPRIGAYTRVNSLGTHFIIRCK